MNSHTKKTNRNIAVVAAALITILSCTGCAGISVDTSAPEEINVTMQATGHKAEGGVIMDVETNLPDGAELKFSLTNDTRSQTPFYMSTQYKVKVADGKATSEVFPDKNGSLQGDYILKADLGMPAVQPSGVKRLIGDKGQYLIGDLVSSNTGLNYNTVNVEFSVSINDEITASLKREEDPVEESTVEAPSENDQLSEEEFKTEVIVAASMELDKHIANYDMSLAPQKWTIAPFDDTDNTVIAITDITFHDRVGKYIYVGTLNQNASGKVESATPHYLEVNGEVLGNDGYCDELFDRIETYLRENK